MRYFVIVLLFFIFMYFAIPDDDAHGLSCERVDMKQHFAESDVVFSGKVISQEFVPSEYGFANGRNDTKTQFHVIESFKGNNTKTVDVVSSEWFWGYDFNKGFEYVVFAYYDDTGVLRHQTCTPTSLLKDADLVKIRQASSFDESFSVIQKQVRYSIPYKITNGVVDDVALRCKDGSLLLQVDAQNESDVNLILDLPRSIMDPKINSIDDGFIVLRDSQEIDYQEFPYEKHRKLSMIFPANTNEIEIIQSFVPELKPKMCEIVHDPSYSYILPPLKQFDSDISFNKIQCKQNLVLIQKYDGTPACVTEQTKQKLIDRGWASNSDNSFENKTNSNATKQTASGLQVDVSGQQQVRRGVTHDITVDVTRDQNPISQAYVRITIEDYGKDIIREFEGRTDDSGRFVFSWEVPDSFDDIETLLAYVGVSDDVSSKTVLFKFQVYCLPNEHGCKVDG